MLTSMSTTTLPSITAFGHALDLSEDKFGFLRDSSDAAADFPELRRRQAEDGYLYMKGYLDREDVLAARATLTERLAAAGMLDERHPALDAVYKPQAANASFKPEITRLATSRCSASFTPGGSSIFTASSTARRSATMITPGCGPFRRAGEPIRIATCPTWAAGRIGI